MKRKINFGIMFFVLLTFLVNKGYANNQGRFNLQECEWFEIRKVPHIN